MRSLPQLRNHHPRAATCCENADALATALRGLGSSSLQVVVAKSDSADVPTSLRSVEIKLVGSDRLGIVSSVTRILAERGISIENMHIEIDRSGVSGKQTFEIDAHLLVPAALSVDALRLELGALASAMMVDIALGERQAPEQSSLTCALKSI